MLKVGMTGGIASGKSTAIAMFRDAGCLVLESDPMVHQLLRPGQAAAAEVAMRPAGWIAPSWAKSCSTIR